MVSSWERKGVNPHPRFLPKLAEALGVSVDELYEEKYEAAPAPQTHGIAEPTKQFGGSLVERLGPLAEEIGLSPETLLSACVDALLSARKRDGRISLPLSISSREETAPRLPAPMRKRHSA